MSSKNHITWVVQKTVSPGFSFRHSQVFRTLRFVTEASKIPLWRKVTQVSLTNDFTEAMSSTEWKITRHSGASSFYGDLPPASSLLSVLWTRFSFSPSSSLFLAAHSPCLVAVLAQSVLTGFHPLSVSSLLLAPLLWAGSSLPSHKQSVVRAFYLTFISLFIRKFNSKPGSG